MNNLTVEDAKVIVDIYSFTYKHKFNVAEITQLNLSFGQKWRFYGFTGNHSEKEETIKYCFEADSVYDIYEKLTGEPYEFDDF